MGISTKHLKIAFLAISVFSINCLLAEDSPSEAPMANPISAVEQTTAPQAAEINLYKAELEAVKAELAASALTVAQEKSENQASKAELLSMKAELDAMKATLAELSNKDASSIQKQTEEKPTVAVTNQTVQHKVETANLSDDKAEIALMDTELADANYKARIAAKTTKPAPTLAATSSTSELYIPAPAEPVKQNEYGQDLWKSKSEDYIVQLETQTYNYKSFTSKLSPLALHEWTQFSREQKQKAMEYADGTQFSPDAAVFRFDTNY